MSSDKVWTITHLKDGVVAVGANSTYPNAWAVAMSHVPLTVSQMTDDEYRIYQSAPVNPTVAELGDYTVRMRPA